jgi:pyridoxal phosphate-dependent aminotransferase EpsN
MDAIVDICAREEVMLVEDAAESLGAQCDGVHTGTIAPFGVYSFNGNKIITSSGGGMLVAKDPALAAQARHLATQARDDAPHYEHSQVGYNYRMSNVVAAIGRGQLRSIEQRVAARRKNYEWYGELLRAADGIELIPQSPFGRANHWLTCATVDPERAGFDRERLREAMERRNIEARPLWKPMHLQPVFAGAPSYLNGVSERLFNIGICLPSGTSLSDSDRERIAQVISGVAGERGIQ